DAVIFWVLNGMLLGLGRSGMRGGTPAVEAEVPVPGPSRLPVVDFRCNVCGNESRGVLLGHAENRECQSCRHCLASLRMRSLMYLLSMELYGKPLVLPEFPVDKRIAGL